MTIQERMRAGYRQLPRARLPKILAEFIVVETVKKLNLFYIKHRVPRY